NLKGQSSEREGFVDLSSRSDPPGVGLRVSSSRECACDAQWAERSLECSVRGEQEPRPGSGPIFPADARAATLQPGVGSLCVLPKENPPVGDKSVHTASRS